MSTTTSVLEFLEAMERSAGFVITSKPGKPHAWDLRNHPVHGQINPEAKLDRLELIREDEGYWHLYHLTHNGVIKGEATFSGAFIGAMYGAVRDFFECL